MLNNNTRGLVAILSMVLAHTAFAQQTGQAAKAEAARLQRQPVTAPVEVEVVQAQPTATPTEQPVVAVKPEPPVAVQPQKASLPPPPAKISSPRPDGRAGLIAEKIATLSERAAILSAQLAEMELLAKVAAKQSEIASLRGQTTLAETFIPSVNRIDGIDGKLQARLIIEGGNTVTVRVGDQVGAWKVKKISIDFVEVQKEKTVLRLGFGSYAPNPTSNSSSPKLSGSPSLPGQP